MKQIKELIKKQQSASNPKNSCWVFASAGSGKTTILTNRVLRLLLDDIDPGKILCLTFTNAAATEMQTRINKELSIWSSLNDTELKEKLHNLSGDVIGKQMLEKAKSLLLRLLDSENKIKVQTIHSFCQGLMKIFPFEANISPTFEILEDKQEKILLKEAINQTFSKAQDNNKIYELITYISSKVNEENLLEILFKVINKKDRVKELSNLIGGEHLQKEFFSIFDLNVDVSQEDIFEKLLETIKGDQVRQLFNKLSKSSSKKNSALFDSYNNFIEQGNISKILNLRSIFFTKDNQVRKLYSNEAKDEQLVNNFSFNAQIVLKYIDKINSTIIAKDSSSLLELVFMILQEYSILKKSNFKVDYNDLITLTNELLKNPEFCDWIKMKMDSSFDHILVDESQDTNHQQWDIIKALSEDFFSGESKSDNSRSIFIVGDEKQSIYSFQGADSTISLDIYKYFKERLGDKLLNIELNNSFRSKKEILDLVDDIFSDEEKAKAISKASTYKKHNAIKEGRGLVEIWPQITKIEERKEVTYDWDLNFGEVEHSKSPAETMAEIIAKRIRDKIDNEGAKFDDFMILLRKRTGDFDKFLNKYLAKYNIEFISPSKIKFSESLLINDLINLAKFCCLKEDDLNLASLLKSPFFKYSEDELLEICNYKNKHSTSIYESLSHLKKEDFDLLNNFKEIAQNSSILDLYYHLIYQKDYYKNFISCFGKNCEPILNSFLNFVSDFEKNYSDNLQIFLEYIDKFDYDLSPIADAKDKVLISTLHSAKGLQAKIVIIPDCCYNFNQLLTSKENIFWHNNLPIWCARKDSENDFVQNLRSEKIKLAKEEYLRLLYVGLTRAEEELYIGGFGNSKDLGNWYEVTKEAAPQYLVNEDEFYKILDSADAKDKAYKSEFINYKNDYLEDCRQAELTQINEGQIIGNIIHGALELIGNNYQIDKTTLKDLSTNLTNTNRHISEEIKEGITSKVNNFIDSDVFQELFFDPNNVEILCESEVSSNDNLYRIDLLIEKENEILIIDYKSDEQINKQALEKYKKQLYNYQNIIANIYKGKKIKTGLLWVSDLRIDWIS